MTEPFFARLAIIVEGPSEREALPILLGLAGLNLDEEGISIVSAGGKTVLDTLVHLYAAHDIPTYVIFDNDKNRAPEERAFNAVLCRLLNLIETDLPEAQVGARCAVLDGDWEQQVEKDLDAAQGAGFYSKLAGEARASLQIKGNRNKPLIARYVAERLRSLGLLPSFASELANAIKLALPAQRA